MVTNVGTKERESRLLHVIKSAGICSDLSQAHPSCSKMSMMVLWRKPSVSMIKLNTDGCFANSAARGGDKGCKVLNYGV